MLKTYFYIFLGLIITGACVHDYELKPIDPSFIFHGNASKVWLINHLYKDKKDHAPLSLKYKEILIFHSSGNCYFYQVNQFQNGHTKKASFKVHKSTDMMTIDFNSEVWKFKVKSYSVNKVILEAIGTKKFPYTIELTSFPEY